MFKSLDADCRRLPGRMGQTIAEAEPVVDVLPEVVVEEFIEPAPAPKPKKKRKPKPVLVETPAPLPEQPAPEFYDYPFVEKIEQEVVAKTQVEAVPAPRVETTYEWTTPELPRERRTKVSMNDNALAYILDAENEASPEEGIYYERVYRDHIETRRA